MITFGVISLSQDLNSYSMERNRELRSRPTEIYSADLSQRSQGSTEEQRQPPSSRTRTAARPQAMPEPYSWTSRPSQKLTQHGSQVSV